MTISTLPRLGSDPPPSRSAATLPPRLDDDEGCDTIATAIRPAFRPRSCALLIRLDGWLAGQTVRLPDGPLRIGRHHTCELRVEADSVSRFHATVKREQGIWMLCDLGSSNGTWVEGLRVKERVLESGDLLRVGPDVTYRFSVVDPQEADVLQRLFEASNRDPLTGACNRRYLGERLREEVAFATRHGTDLSVLMLDLDHFKAVNDRLGHAGGDAVLQHVAKLALSRVRHEDVVARYGGEEFAVVLRGVPVEGAARAAERLRAAVEASSLGEGRVPVTLSAGCAALGEIATPASAAALLAAADRRLYVAKANGRNRVIASG